MEEFYLLIKNDLELYLIQKKLFSFGLQWKYHKLKYHDQNSLGNLPYHIGVQHRGNGLEMSVMQHVGKNKIINWHQLNAINPD
jgi:hypothetical protein